MPRSVAMRARSTSSPAAISASSKAWRLAICSASRCALALDAAPRRARGPGRCARSRSPGSRRSRRGASRPRPWSPRRAFSASAIWRSSSAISSAFCRSISSSLCARSRSMRACLERELERDLLALGLLAGLQLGFVERPAARDLAALRVFFVLDALLGDAALLRQPRLLDRLARRRAAPARPPGRAAPARGRARRAARRGGSRPRAPARAAHIRSRGRSRSTLLLRLEVLVADLDQRALLDLVAHLAARLDRSR